MVIPVTQETRRYNKSQLTYLTVFFTTYLLNSVVFTATGPLYPPEAMSKGLSASLYGGIISVTCAAMAITSLFASGAESIGLKSCLGWSVFSTGIGTILLGIVHFIASAEIFVSVSVLSFAISGFGDAVMLISIYILCFSVFTGNNSFAIGIIEGGSLIGICFGPLLTELVNGAIGYPTTFLLLGIMQILNSMAIFTLLPIDPAPAGLQIGFKDMLSGYLEILKFPSVWIFAVSLAMLEMGSDFVSAILEPSLHRFNLDHTGVGLMFFASGIPQILTPFWGLILEKISRPELVLAANFIFMSMAMTILGPVAACYSEKVPTILGLFLFGLGQGIFDVSAIVNFQLEVKEKRIHESVAVNNTFTAVFYAFVTGVGGLIGPSVAGVLYDQVGFGNALLFPLSIYATLGVVVLMHMSLKRCRAREVSSGAEYGTL